LLFRIKYGQRQLQSDLNLPSAATLINDVFSNGRRHIGPSGQAALNMLRQFQTTIVGNVAIAV
jgi:hypothetical protein